jgi:hypothetical protein
MHVFSKIHGLQAVAAPGRVDSLLHLARGCLYGIRKSFGLVTLGILGISCQAIEDDAPRTWVSPNHRFAIHHTAASEIGSYSGNDPAGSQGSEKATYTLTQDSVVLWSGVSWVDESAHEFHCQWAPDSSAALILDRPARGSIEACLVQTLGRAHGSILGVQRIIHRVLTKAGDTDDRILEKAWFGEWRFSKGRVEGVVIVARARYYRLHLILDPSAEKPTLVLREEKAFEEWNDRMGKL